MTTESSVALPCPVCETQISSTGSSHGLCPGCLLDLALGEISHDPDATMTWGHADLETSEPTDLPESIGQYRILSKLGEGGMGIVFEAEQQNPKRRVALKVVRGGQFIDDSQVKMFQREAETLGRLKHANIGAIYESGRTESGQHFFAMELVRGETLDTHLARYEGNITPAEIERRLRLFQRIVDAVHYAHQRGVIHRDLKPSNIIVTEAHSAEESTSSGIPEVKILDFGLARITEGDIAAATVITEVGLIKGTLPYMSPEQARGLPEEIDLRTDVYALGVILYEMLAGQRPYDTQKSSLIEAVRVIQETSPTPLQQVWNGTRALDPDLETVVGKTLEKEADQRYDSAASLSDDVGRYLASQPIQARPPSTIYLLKKLVERNRIGTAFAATVLGLLLGTGIWISVLYVRALSAESAALESLNRSEASKLLALARLEEERYPTAALAYATKSLDLADTKGARRLSIKTLWRAPPARIFPVDWTPNPCGPRVAVSPDGDWFSISSQTGEVRLFSRDGTTKAVLEHPPLWGQWSCWWQVEFAPNSDVLLTYALNQREMHIWSIPEGSLIDTIEVGPADLMYALGRIRGNRILAITFPATPSNLPGHLQSWPLTGGAPDDIATLSSQAACGGDALDIDPTGTWMACTASDRQTIYRMPLEDWDDPNPEVLGIHDGAIWAIWFSPAGDRLFVADDSNARVGIWRLDQDSIEPSRILSNVISERLDYGFDPSGTRFAWGSDADRSIYLMDLSGSPSAQQVALKRHDEDRIRRILFDPQGEWLLSAYQRSLSFWPLDQPLPRKFTADHQFLGGANLDISSDGEHLVSCSRNLRIWALTPEGSDYSDPTNHLCYAVAAHPEEPEILTAGPIERRGILFRSLEDHSTHEPFSIPEGAFEGFATALAVDADRQRWVVGTLEPGNPLMIWSQEMDEDERVPWGPFAEEGEYVVHELKFTPDGTLFSAGEGGVVQWDLDGRTSELFLESRIARIDLSRDGRYLLVTAGEAFTDVLLERTALWLIDLETGTRQEIVSHGEAVQRVAFHPDADIIVTGDVEGAVRVGPSTGEEPHLLLGHDVSIKDLIVSPDGRWIFSAAGNEVLQWPMPDLSQRPLHILSQDELIAHLQSLTNLRVVEAPATDDGWKLEIGPFSE